MDAAPSERKSSRGSRSSNAPGEARTSAKVAPPGKQQEKKKWYGDKNVELVEDVFGVYLDADGCRNKVKRFTWTNRNKIEVQVINYGARIVCAKMPDKLGNVADLVLGCEDLAGYVYYGQHYLGATIGRVSDVVRYGTCKLVDRQIWLDQNKDKKHHYNGGLDSIDKMVWATHVDRNKVIMSIVSPHLKNGYPGDLFIRVTFELSPMNEFKIDMEAQTTVTTLVNLSNLTYFNLAGHHAGPDELYRHVVTLNCNCYTPMKDGLPTGEIVSVVHSPFDFQVPVRLGKVMGIVPKDGFEQNLCVNRGVEQESCFVGRAWHVPSGRMLEMYSNQMGVKFSTANHFGFGERLEMSQLLAKTVQEQADSNELEEKLILFRKIHENMSEVLKVDREENLVNLLDLIIKLELHKCKSDSSLKSIISLSDLITVTPLQKKYLESMLEFACQEEDSEECLKLQDIVRELLSIVIVEDREELSSVASVVEKTQSVLEEELRLEKEKMERQQRHLASARLRAQQHVNFIPPYYRESKSIIGKNGVRYRMHGGFALQSQNYPNAINFKNFPSCVVKPGETYKHNITYKFWIRAGNPTKWIKRNLINDNKAKLF